MPGGWGSGGGGGREQELPEQKADFILCFWVKMPCLL